MDSGGFHNELTRRESEVLVLVARGRNNRDIADELSLSLRTIKFHTGNIYSKLGVKSRSEAIVWAWEHTQIAISSRKPTKTVPKYSA